jgi:type II secretory pathway component PulC
LRFSIVRRLPSLVLLVASLGACGGGSRAPVSAAASATPVGSAAAPQAPKVRTRFTRREIVDTLSRGLGAFLARIQVEPSLSDGRFHGWRIIALGGSPGDWEGVDLAPGDVVTDVNGRSVERPEEALSSWQSLAVAKELRVGRERRGERRELVYPIDD